MPKHGCRDAATGVDDMRQIQISACLAIIAFEACLASAALSTRDLDKSWQSALTKAGSFASSFVSSFAARMMCLQQARRRECRERAGLRSGSCRVAQVFGKYPAPADAKDGVFGDRVAGWMATGEEVLDEVLEDSPLSLFL